MQRTARVTFVAAAWFALMMATVPHPPPIPGDPSDKVMHIIAFAVLGCLAAWGYRNRTVAVLFAGLVAFGALIEIIQAIPMLNRDSDFGDWIADAAAALLALSITRWVARRTERGV